MVLGFFLKHGLLFAGAAAPCHVVEPKSDGNAVGAGGGEALP